MDSASSHNVNSLSNVEVKYLPPNLMCELLLNQHIICALKKYYHKLSCIMLQSYKVVMITYDKKYYHKIKNTCMLDYLVTKSEACKDAQLHCGSLFQNKVARI